MQTLKQQVEDYVGESVDDLGALDRWLQTGASLVVELIPPEDADEYASTIAVPSGGLDLSDYRVVAAFKTDIGAPFVPSFLYARLADSSSIHYASTTNPRAVIRDGKLYVLPGGGDASVIQHPQVSFDHGSVGDFPEHINTIVVLYAAIQILLQKLPEKEIALSALSFTMPSAPSEPSAPAFDYVPAISELISATTISALATAPTYTKPTLSISASAPNALSAPSFTYTNAEIATVVEAVNTLAAQIATAYTQLSTDLVTSQDIELAQADIQEIQTRILQYRTETEMILQKAIQNATQTNDVRKQNALQQLVKDVQQYDGTIKRFQQELGQYQADIQKGLQTYQLDIQNELNEFNKEVVVYQTDLQHKLEQARLDQQRIVTAANQATEVRVANAAKDLEEQVNEYRLSIERFAAQVQTYASQVGKEVQRVQTQIAQINAERDITLAHINELRKELSVLLSQHLGARAATQMAGKAE